MLRNKNNLPYWAGLTALLVVVGAIFIALASSDGDPETAPTFGTPITGAIVTATPAPATNTPAPGETPAPTETPAPATAVPQPSGVTSEDKLVIGSIGVNASLVHLEVPLSREMPAPEGPLEVAIYSFADGAFGGIPGQGGNIIIAGHVDLASYGPAVFWNLRNVKADEILELRWEGQTYRYSVQASFLLTGETSPEWNQVLAPSDKEVLTLITCDGDFNPVTREYDSRRVVQAIRVN